MRTFLILAQACLKAWIVISPLVWIYWTFKPGRRPINRATVVYFAFMGALLGIGLLCSAGFDTALSFIPRSWGGVDENGDFVGTRRSLANFLGFVASGCVLWLLYKTEALSEENNEIREELEKRKAKNQR